MKTFLTAIFLPFVVFLSGCAADLPPQAINENSLVRVAALDESGLFAANHNGRKVAVSKDGLRLLDLSGSQKKLSPNHPVALAWSPDGLVLAAAFLVADYETRLTRYSAQGELLSEALLPVKLSQMLWSARGDLLLTGFALKAYSFGGDLLQMFYRVNDEEIVETLLSNTTLKLATMQQLLSIMQKILSVAFSSSGDEFVYVHLHDPPQFRPYLRLVYHNWRADMRRPLQRVPLQAVHIGWDQYEDSVVIQSANGVHNIDLWPTADDSVGQPVVDPYRFIDGRLYDGEQLLANWGEGARLQILSDGRFLLAVKKALYQGDGLRAGLIDAYSERAWTLRRWRFEGLVTPEEYLKLLREETP